MLRGGVKDLRADLRRRIDAREATIAVVGLGYVGLPVACSFASRGFSVRGFDIDAVRVDAISSGENPLDTDEPGLTDLIVQATSGRRLETASDPAVLRGADVYLVAVETPVGDDHVPSYDALRAACGTVAAALRPGALVVIESTVSPGTTGGIVRATLEAGSGLVCERDLYLGHCPERLMPGRLLENIRTLHRVCGGSSPATAALVAALYRHIVSADLDPVDLATAELVKTTENAYYDVNIAFANEVALICEDLGADVADVRRLVNKSPGRNMLVAGAGVGGACIPKDPWLLAAAPVRVAARLIAAARDVNDGMPAHVVDLARAGLAHHGRTLAGSLIGVLGAAYRENTKDDRNSPTMPLVRALREEGATVCIHDPLVEPYRGPLSDVTDGADAVLLMVAHDEYSKLDVLTLRQAMRTPVVVDGRRVFDPASAEAAGLTYLAVGRAARWS